jgi:hypothetical protein
MQNPKMDSPDIVGIVVYDGYDFIDVGSIYHHLFTDLTLYCQSIGASVSYWGRDVRFLDVPAYSHGTPADQARLMGTRPAKISEHSLSKAEHHVKDDLFKLRAFLGDLSAYEKMILRLQHDIEILVDLKAITLKLAHTLENFSRED